MYKLTDIFRCIVTYGSTDSFDIKTSSTQICGNQHLKFPISKVLYNALPALLRFTTMILSAASIKPAFDYFQYFLALRPGVNEHDYRSW